MRIDRLAYRAAKSWNSRFFRYWDNFRNPQDNAFFAAVRVLSGFQPPAMARAAIHTDKNDLAQIKNQRGVL